MSLLDIEALCVRYGDTSAVDGLSLSIDAGEAVGLVGESGSGKTQTALAVMGLLPADARISGSIRFDGKELIGAPERALDRLRAVSISMVFQDPADALNPYLRVGEQLERILLAHGLADAGDAGRLVVDMLDRVGLPDPMRQSRAWPHQLSGGMRQRALIASALITRPRLLIADEPTTALDVTVQAQILALLDAVRGDTALLLITHDLGVVAGHTGRVIVVRQGRLVEAGDTAAVFAEPQAAHTRALLAAAPRPADASPPEHPGGAPLLTVRGASVRYRESGHGWLDAVKSVDLSIKERETVAIVGESGSGKSSLARALLGLTEAAAGDIVYAGQPLARDVSARDAGTRGALQLVFQDPLGSLNPQLRIGVIVAEPLTVHEPGLGRAARASRVAEMLDRVGLGPDFADRFPHELSGGQAQRVAIARALVLAPRILVCDEAVAALDGTVRRQILALLADIQQQSGLAILFISHDLGVVSEFSHRVIVMYLGRIVEAAATADLFRAPTHPYTRALIDAIPVVGKAARETARLLGGEIPSPLAPPAGCAFHPRCAFAEDRCRRERPELRPVGGSSVSCHRAEEIEALATSAPAQG